MIRKLTLVAATALIAAFGTASFCHAETLRLLTWGGYAPDAVVKKFKEDTGIDVEVTISNNEDFISKLRATGGAGFDLAQPSQARIPGPKQEFGIYKPFDLSKLDKSLWLPDLLAASEKNTALDGKVYGIAHIWGNVDLAVLLLDEPLGAFDLKLREHMKIELKLLQQQFGTTFVYINHDQSEALVMSDKVAVMNAGQFEQDGTPQELYHHPSTAFVAGFVGDNNRLAGTVVVLGQLSFIATISTLVIAARLRKFDRSLEEAALNLGATPTVALFTIILPFLRPAMVGSAIVAFLISFENFNTTLILNGSNAPLTIPMFDRMREGSTPVLNAVSLTLMFGSGLLGLLGVLAQRDRSQT